MRDFYYYNPTKVIFGKEKQKTVGLELKLLGKKRVLLHYGKSSVLKNNLLADVKASLEENQIEYLELPGVVSNPEVSLINEGARLVKKKGIDFVLALGGGSAIDSSKGIAASFYLETDLWTHLKKGGKITQSLAYGTILTLPASGSEMNNVSIISNSETKDKIGFTLQHPSFSILNAELCMSAPKKQIGYGIFDMFSHMVEMYFTPTRNVEVIDNMLVGNMRTVQTLGREVYRDSENYDLYAQVMWAGTMAHNYIFSLGRLSDWSSHQIEHEISAYYDVAHAPGLSVVMLSWMKHVYREDIERFAQFTSDVFGIRMNAFNLEETALKGIAAFERFIKDLDMPVTFDELGIDDKYFEEIANKLTADGKKMIGNFKKLEKAEVKDILLSPWNIKASV